MPFEAYRKIVSVLRQHCPLAYPVVIRRVKLNGLDGDCSLHKKKFYIRINNDMNESGAIDTLLHEWAHGRAWNHLHDALGHDEFEECSHDASWGVAYSEVYRVYEKHYLSDIKK